MKKLELFVTAMALISQPAFAGSDRGPADLERNPNADVAAYDQPASGGVSTTDKSNSLFASSLRDEVLGISPQVGIIGFSDVSGNYTSRIAEGLSIDFNVMPLVGEAAKDYFLGVSTGAFYSHMGSGTSNFFGANADDSDPTSAGANLAVIPVDVKAGYNVTDKIRVSAHGGGNLTYRSVGSAADFGSVSSGTSQEVWRIFPNAGADLEWTVANGVTLTARPDATFTTGQVVYMGTIGVVAPLSL